MKNQRIVFIIFCSILIFNISNSNAALVEKTNIIQDNSSDIPSYFSWTDIGGVDFTTPIREQQPYQACEAFSFVAALEVMIQWKVGYPFGCDLSEAHLYFCSGGNTGWGSYPENDSNYLVEYGVPDEACWPYPNYLKEPEMFPKNTTCSNWQERTVKIKNWSYLPAGNITAIKEALVNNGPVPAHLHSYQDFGYYDGGIYTHKWGDTHGLHCVCIMGYKDDPSIPSGGYWIVKNSWGTHLRQSGRPWGENGWARIAYGEASIEEMALLFEGVYGQFPILYVDDDNTMGPWNGSEEYPYSTIKDAMDNAYDGWTIFVKNGTYYENLVIDKKINIDGENPETTIIDGNDQGIVLYVKRPNVRISGLTIQNSGSNRLDSGIRTLTLDSNLTVKNCMIQDNDVGIYLNCADVKTYTSTKNMIYNNTIKNNNIGIFTIWIYNNEIIGNSICKNNLYGIETEESKFSIIKDNEICDNKQIGIYLHGDSAESIVAGNLIKNSTNGIIIKETNSCEIKSNNFIDNTEQAGFIRSIGNIWRNNYWSDWGRILPRPIKGTINLWTIPWINFDWMPAAQQI